MRLDASAALAGHADRRRSTRSASPSADAPRRGRARRACSPTFPGQVAMVSSFGAEAAVLLKMVADIDRTCRC